MANAQFQVAPAERLPFPDAAFDLLTCRIAPHHFDSVPAFLAESYRVLAPGGRLLLADTTTPEECADWQNAVERLRDQSHVRNYTPAQWRSMAEAAGFTVEAFEILAGTVLVSLNDWLEKAGCAGAPADQVRGQFATAPATARQAFQISAREDDFEFAWLRVAFAGAKRK
jgi:SAM-dependent methyltransferase